MIAVVDYGMGNLRSVSKALERLGAAVTVTSQPDEIAAAEKVILPGVGAFGAAMDELNRRNLVAPITAAIAAGRPYLGICLGLQLLFRESEESPGVAGFGVLPGTVRRFTSSNLKIPHMGWNQVTAAPLPAGTKPRRNPLLDGIPSNSFFYFVHSYYGDPTDKQVIALQADYGAPFPAMLQLGKLFATQFHPEKSQAVGLKLLENFVKLP